MAQTPLIYVEGTAHKPELVAEFSYHTRYAKRPQMKLVDFVKELPDRKWDPSQKVWTITGVGPEPQRLLTEAGFDILWAEDFDSIDSLDELVQPRAKLADNGGGVYIRPRLLGRKAISDIIGPGAIWESKKNRYWVPLGEIVPVADQLDFLGDDILDALEARTTSLIVPDGAEDYPLSELASSVSAQDISADFGDIVDGLADIPDWYGLGLFEYQRLGAIAAWGGFRMICDEPGLGKTRTAMAAAAMHAPERVLISSPPVGVTHWMREAEVSRLAYASELSSGEMSVEAGHADPDGGEFIASDYDERFTGRIVAIRSGKKMPELPERGIVVVADSYLSTKPELQAQLAAWEPDVFVTDEIHRHSNIETQRTKATIATSIGATYSYGITGTPVMRSPQQLPSQLLITDTLEHFGGSVGGFLETYCRKTKFGGWEPRKREAHKLGRIMDSKVWVRRTKAKAQPQLPKRSRRVEWLDVPLKDYRAAMGELTETMHELIEKFVDRESRLPTSSDINTVVPNQMRFSSPLRVAAGMVKIPDAKEWITEHLDSTGVDDGVYDRPLIAWVWHDVVAKALAEELSDYKTATIVGSVSSDNRDAIVDRFQTGRIGVLIASISAANVAITLTRSCDAVFVESDWTPSNVSQAEDRINRIGQTRPVTITTLSGVGTLDERMHGSQIETSEVLDAIMKGGNNLVSDALEDHIEDPMLRLGELVRKVFTEALKKWDKKTLGRKK